MPDGDNIGLRCKMGRNESCSKGCNEQRLSLLINLVLDFWEKMSKKCERFPTQLPKVQADVIRSPKVQIKSKSYCHITSEKLELEIVWLF